jgi:hypothetical protein
MTNELDAPVDAGIEREAMAEIPAAPSPARVPSPPTARKTATKPVASSKKAAAAKKPGKAAKKSAARPARAGATTASKKKAGGPTAGVVRLKFGAHEVWMARAIAGALSSKDKKKLKALLKRAGKRARKAD